MSDLTFPDDGRAELASAYLDGAVTANERARVDADPQLMALVGDLRSVSQSLASAPVTAADSLREQHLATALAVFVTADEAAAASRSVVPRRPSWRTRWLTPLIGVGAATVIVAGVGLASLGGDDGGIASNADRATVLAAEQPATSLEAATKMAAPAGGQAPTSDVTVAGASEMAVPEYADTVSSVAALPTADVMPSASDPAELAGLVTTLASISAPSGVDPCPEVGGTLVSPLRWQEIDALLYVVPGVEAGAQVLAVDALTCATLASSVLPG